MDWRTGSAVTCLPNEPERYYHHQWRCSRHTVRTCQFNVRILSIQCQSINCISGESRSFHISTKYFSNCPLCPSYFTNVYIFVQQETACHRTLDVLYYIPTRTYCDTWQRSETTNHKTSPTQAHRVRFAMRSCVTPAIAKLKTSSERTRSGWDLPRTLYGEHHI